MKVCSNCKQEKPLGEFYKHSRSSDGHDTKCKVCAKAYAKAWNIANNDKRKAYRDKQRLENRESLLISDRRAKLKKKYGITLEQYDVMFEEQNRACKICHEPPSDPRGYRLSVDHCHDTGKVRGLLCGNCNNGIGRFKHSKELLHNAIKYLD